MSLYENMATEFVRVYKTVKPDAFGGNVPTYVEGESFKAYAQRLSNTELRVAEKAQKIGNYLITVLDKSIVFEQNELIRFTDDLGRTITLKLDVDNKIVTPNVANFDVTQMYGYEINLV